MCFFFLYNDSGSDYMEVKIERLDHQGRGIAKVNNVTTFIPNALVGETVDIELTQKKKKFGVGKVNKYINVSPDRVEAICPHFPICGGCDLMHMKYLNQLQFKQDKVKNIIGRYTSIHSNKIENILNGKEYYYRNKVTFQVKEKIGFFDKKSYDIVPIEYCYIASKKINEILSILKTCDLKNIAQIMIRTNEKDIMVVIYSKQNISEEIIDRLQGRCSLLRYDMGYKVINGNNSILDTIGDYQFIISPASFFQVNRNTVKILYDKVLEYLCPNKNEVVLDLYSGTGTIGIYISRYVKKVISVEMNVYAVKDAVRNKEMNHVDNIEFMCDDVANVIDKFKHGIDSIIVDPPRSGLDAKTINYLKEIGASKIVYVSCDPITLARDLEKLSASYDVNRITPVDMFPNTYHVECVSLFSLKKGLEKSKNIMTD